MAVTVVTDENFAEALKSKEKTVVKYYAGWCGTCRLLAPKYRRLSDEEQYDGVAFLDVDAEYNPEARKLAGVTNLPFVATFKGGEMVEAMPVSKIEKVIELLEKL
ncbi:MAG: thioredoxin family protein [Cyclobacteriaceae bacterium]|nr:thioredoxin family protein [Cyclobacteriaceae bacterium]